MVRCAVRQDRPCTWSYLGWQPSQSGAAFGKLPLRHDLVGEVVVDLDRAVVGCGGEKVRHRTAADAVDAAGVVVEQLPRLLARRREAEVNAPDAAVGVLGVPDGRVLGEVLDHGAERDVLAHLELVERLDLQLDALLARLGAVDGLKVPHADRAVLADRVNVALVQRDLLHGARVARLVLLAADLGLNEPAVPQQHVAPLGAGEHFAVGQLGVAFDVRDLRFAELAQIALQLVAGERARHLPELDVAGAGRGEDAFQVLGKGDLEDVLREGLGPQHDLLVLPVPDGQHEVGRRALGSEQLSART